MAWWPFDKKRRKNAEEPNTPENSSASEDLEQEISQPSVSDTLADKVASQDTPDAPQSGGAFAEPVEMTQAEQSTGPFDGDTVEIDQFDFSDFSNGILNLGSIKLPLPKGSQVQVEMGEQGPKMLHIVTEYGRITPVAFAAPRSAGQWRNTVPEIISGMEKDGLEVDIEDGPWGREITGSAPLGRLRIIGIDGPRWMLRFTLAGPEERSEELTAIARELAARTFVYRGDSPILAGNSLPVALPQQLVEQVRHAMQQRNQQAQQQQQDSGENNPRTQGDQ